MKTRPLSAETFSKTLILASLLQVLEGALPKLPLFPWLKLGISYIVVLPFFAAYGALPAAMLLLGRNLLAWVLGGQPLSSFLIGSSAVISSFLLVGSLLHFGLRRNLLGYLGAGIVLAVTLNLAQLASVEFLFVRDSGFYFQIPVMLIWSLVSGGGMALLAFKASPLLETLWSGEADSNDEARKAQPRSWRKAQLAFLLLQLGCAWMLTNLYMQGLLFLISCLAVLFGGASVDGKSDSFKAVPRAWPLFLFQAWFHLWQGEGTFIAWGWLTREGVSDFLSGALRLANIILLGPSLVRLLPRHRLHGSLSPFLRGFALTLDRLPSLLATAPRGLKPLRSILRGDFSLLDGDSFSEKYLPETRRKPG